MLQYSDKKVNYKIDENDGSKFIIENYNRAKPFSSFFPGIAGVMGIPLWCFYVNRGQCIASFGTESKDGAIMEFQPANKSYRLTSTQGFRTFIKFGKGNGALFYEPFNDSQANNNFDLESKMKISSHDLEIEEINKTLGLKVTVKYFTLPNEPVAALAREVRITNLLENSINIEIIDGMPVINLYGLNDGYVKNMSRTMEAWSYVENLENGVPFYRLKVLPNDSTEVIPIHKGNFYLSFSQDAFGKMQKLQPIIDPALVFGPALDFSYPYAFLQESFKVSGEQHFENRTPSAMGHAKLMLPEKSEKSVYTLVGHVESIEKLNKLVQGFMKKGYFEQKSMENAEVIGRLVDKAFVSSSSAAFDAYAKQNFLDNILRGGYPLTLEAEGKKDVLYVYSRRHGDLERDYNSFRLMPTYFSQGNGAYRDINQNRRNDVWFNPDVGYSNILYFVDLIQLDGYNPLVVKGLSYIYRRNSDSLEKLKLLVEEKQADKLLEFLQMPYIPYSLICFLQDKGIKLKKSLQEVISVIMLDSRKVEEAEHGEGYWSDHWFYNTDLLESYAAMFPDKLKELLLNKKIFSFYDDGYFVVPRKDRYILNRNGEPRQHGSVKKDAEKLQLINSRLEEPNKMRTVKGKGEIYYTSLFVKLMNVCINKIASLDAHGVGIEMEADKPNWDDALNGLPALFGSSASETLELLRLVSLLEKWIVEYSLSSESIMLPEEIYLYFTQISDALKQNLECDSPEGEFRYWDSANTAKEIYRERTFYGIDGKEVEVKIAAALEFLEICRLKLERAKEKAFNKELGIYNTYFINKPLDFQYTDGIIEVKSFDQIPLPAFLEGQVHALKNEKEWDLAKRLYTSVRESDLYDKKLGMYKVNGSLGNETMELGRIRAFTPGWLENESIFLHMEYKYLLELVKSGLYEEYHQDSRTALVPYMEAATYGRSIFENSSFVASSANPDEAVHGGGYVARLSGTTSEFYNILLVITLGKRPFSLDEKGELVLELKPGLHNSMFATEAKKVDLYASEGKREELLEKNTFGMCVFGKTLLVYHNPKRLNTYGSDSARIISIKLSGQGIEEEIIEGSVIPSPLAEKVREGVYDRIDVWLE